MKPAFLLIAILHVSVCLSQVTISGFIEDSQTKEQLSGVTIFDINSKRGTISNSFGFYSLSFLHNDTTQLIYSYVGYKKQIIQILPTENMVLNIQLESGIELNEVAVTHEKSKVQTPVMSILQIPIKQITQIPALMGEVDVMRAFQLMPGVQGGKEGTSSIYVRGGGPDQNLILLDDIPLYYVNHIGGYVSVFNPEAIKSIDLYKGGFPARYGGRLSAVLDIRMKEGNMNNFSGNVSVGIITSKFSIEGPVKKGKTSFIVSARRSFFDLFTRGFQYLNSDKKFSAGYALYDLNAKINHIINQRNRLYFSIYSGRDKIFIKQKDYDSRPDYPYDFKSENNINWGNHCLALRWNHVYSQQLFSNVTIGYTRFFYNSFSDIYKIEKQSDKTVGTLSNHFTSAIDDIIGKIDFDYYLTNHQIKFGCVFTLHQFSPTMNRVYQNGTPDSNIDTTFGAVKINPIEFISYIEDKFSLTEKLSFNIGFHFCSLTESGRSYYSLQPRIIGNYTITNNLAFKFSYTKMMQPVHLLSNNDAGLPTDLWVPATKEVKPQQSSLFALGITGEILRDHSFEWSIETFYKTMDNLIEFSDGASFFTGTADWKQKIEKDGKGTVYGIELLLQKKKGNTTGWIAYTLSKNVRQFDRLNFGKPYPYKYDRRHDFSITVIHKFNDRTQLSASWIFASGNATTLPSTMYELYVLEWEKRDRGNIAYIYDEVHIYGKRNNYRTPIYHRLDISLDLIKKRQRGTRTWTLGLYNAYNRLNSYYLYFNYDKSGERKLYSFSLFPIIPSISYNYRF